MQPKIDRWLNEGRALIAHKDYALALIPLRHLVSEALPGSESSAAWLLQSQSLHALGHTDQALAAANQAVQDQPASLEAKQQRAKLYFLLKQYAESAADLEDMTHTQPDNPSFWEQLGSAYLELARYKDALTTYDTALAIQPTYPRALHGRAVALDNLGRQKEAIAAYRTAYRFTSRNDPLYIWVLTNFSRVLRRARHVAEALDVANEATQIKATPAMRAKAWCELGDIQMELRRDSEALTSYEQACAINPIYALGWYGKGNALITLNEPQAALVAYDEAIRLDPLNMHVLKQRQIALASTLLSKSPPLAPDDPAFSQINDIGIWEEQIQRYTALRRAPELEGAANQVLRLDARKVNASVTKAAVQVMTRRYRSALETLQQSWRSFRTK